MQLHFYSGINGGAYTYWGAHEFRIFDYPLVIGVLEAAQVICFAVGASILRERSTSSFSLLGLFVLFPFTFFGASFGAGSAVIIALHLEDPSRVLAGLASLLSMGFAVVMIRAAGSVLPVANGVPTRSEADLVGVTQQA